MNGKYDGHMMGQGTEEQAPPQGGLGFLVYGLARSGTSATAKYLSAVPGVHCGNEIFPTFLDHAGLRAPQAFLSHPDPFWNADSVDEVRARQDEITVYGNKTPTYFYNLTALYGALGPVPSVLCLRPLDQVAASYAMRAADPDDDWPDGRGALFACADALILLYALHQLEGAGHILALPQGALKTDWRAAVAQVLAHVAPGVPATYRDADLRAIARRRDSSAARSKPQVAALAQVERDALGKLTSIGAAAFFANPRLGPVSARRDEIGAILAQAPSDPIDWMRRAVARHPNPQAEVFFQTWSRHVARVTQRIGARV